MRRWAPVLLLACALQHAAPVAAADGVAIVVAPGIGPTALSRSTVRAIFGMRLRSWPDNRLIHVFVLAEDDPRHSEFCKQVINVFPHQLRSAWDRLVFSGTGEAPRVVPSEEEMRAMVATTPGAIGYLSESMLDGSIQAIRVR